jgi:hypothetical protein
MFGLNSYSWCGASATYQSSGYDTLVSMFQSTSIPVFFSEYGCNLPAGVPRVFNEVQALYGPQMTGLNGGLVYEYSNEVSNYGLVNISSDNSVHLLVDYDNLQGQYNKLDIKTLQSTSVPSAGNPPTCDPSLITNSTFSTNFTIPAQPPGAADAINNGISNPPSGKLVSIPSLNVNLPVFGSNGKAITGLAVKQISGSNLPSGQSTSGGSSGNSTTAKKGSAPGRTDGSASAALFAGVMAAVLVFSI